MSFVLARDEQVVVAANLRAGGTECTVELQVGIAGVVHIVFVGDVQAEGHRNQGRKRPGTDETDYSKA